MKKVLLATTALVASAGIAAAEVTITGFAEIGVFDPGDDDGEELQFHTDIDATFTMSTETDSGLSFGASIDLDESDTDRTITDVVVNEDEEGGSFGIADDITVGGSPAFDNDSQGGETIFIAGPFGTLTMGDTDGAYDFALQEAIIGSAITDDHEHAGYNGNAGLDGTYDGQIARYEYTFGDFAVAVSGEIDDDGVGDPVLGIGATYSTAFGSFRGNPINIGLGIGYQRVDELDPIDDIEEAIDGEDEEEDDDINPDIWGVSADLDLGGGLRAIVNYSDGEDGDGGEVEHYGIAVGYTLDALTVAANYGRFNRDEVDIIGDGGEVTGTRDNDSDGYGIVVNYDLGGGAEAQFGYGHSDNDDPEEGDNDQYSIGIAISF